MTDMTLLSNGVTERMINLHFAGILSFFPLFFSETLGTCKVNH